MDWLFGKKDVGSKASKLANGDRSQIRPAPVDPTLEAAYRETSARIKEKAQEINKLSTDIIQMTDSLVAQFKGKPK